MSTHTDPTPLGELLDHLKVAADLRTLATLAERNPAIGAELARELAELYVVLDRSAPVTREAFRDAALAVGAEPSSQIDSDDPWFITLGVTMPAGAMRLVVTQLAPVSSDPE